jgi:ArsR family transcriptional regulator
MKTYAEKFKALGDETRLRILYLLIKADSDLCVCELTDALEIPQYNISKHLKILRHAGLIAERKEGRWVYFGIVENDDSFSGNILHAINHIPDTLLSNDVKELHNRLAIREHGKCLIGIQKTHLISSNPKKEGVTHEAI